MWHQNPDISLLLNFYREFKFEVRLTNNLFINQNPKTRVFGPKDILDPHAAPYRPLQSSLSEAGAVAQDLGQDWSELQHVSAGGRGSSCPTKILSHS